MSFFSIVRIATFASLAIIQINQANVYSSNVSFFYPENYHGWEANFTPILRNTINVDNSSNIYGGRLAIANFFYHPNFIELGLDASVISIWSNAKKNKADFSSHITILSPAIIGRWYLYQHKLLTPFVEAGIGPSYMTNNNFDGKKLGMQFAFQDIASAGLIISDPYSHHSPKEDNTFILGVYVVHYSNGGLNRKNRGITLPVSLRLGYRF